MEGIKGHQIPVYRVRQSELDTLFIRTHFSLDLNAFQTCSSITAHVMVKHRIMTDTVGPIMSNVWGSRRVVHSTRPHETENSCC